MRPRAFPSARPGAIVLLGLVLLSGASRQPAEPSFRSDSAAADDAVLRGRSLLYRESYYPAGADSATAAEVSILPDAGASGIDISMPPVGATLSGEVWGEDAPLAGVVVEAYRGAFVVAGLTGASGNFDLEGVPAGTVRVRFSTDHPLSAGKTYESIYFGGVRLPGQATPVETHDGETTPIGKTTLGVGTTLAGQVRAMGGEPVAEAEVTILADAESWSTRTDEDGNFAQGGLPAATFWVRVRPPLPYLEEFFGGSRDSTGATPLLLAPGEQRTGVDVEVDPGAEIHGQIRREGTNEPLSGFEVQLRLRGGPAVRSTFTDEVGFYGHIGLPAGSYLVFVPRMHRYFPNATNEDDARAITVEEGEIRTAVDITGPDLGGCAVPPDQQGVITGFVQADFSRIDRATLRAFSELDTVEQLVTEEGQYHLGCLPDGSYRVALVPNGTLRTQYHPKVHELDDAIAVFVAGDTVMAVDFVLEKSSWIEGVTQDAETGDPVPGVRVSARRTSGIEAESRADELGRYRIDRLADGSGLPAGDYLVRADSTLVPDPDVTPVLQPWMEVRPRGSVAAVHWELPAGLEWWYELSRHATNSDMEAARVRLTSGVAGAGETAAGVFYDRPMPGRYLYRLEAQPAEGDVFVVQSAVVEILAAANLVLEPNPWMGSGTLRLTAPHGGGPGVWLEVIDVSGRRAYRAGWPADPVLSWDGRGSRGALLPSGVYFVRQVDPAGRERARGELRVVR